MKGTVPVLLSSSDIQGALLRFWWVFFDCWKQTTFLCIWTKTPKAIGPQSFDRFMAGEVLLTIGRFDPTLLEVLLGGGFSQLVSLLMSDVVKRATVVLGPISLLQVLDYRQLPRLPLRDSPIFRVLPSSDSIV